MTKPARGPKQYKHPALSLLLQSLGTQKAIADDLGLAQTSVSNWVRVGNIPNHHMPRLLALCPDEQIRERLSRYSRAAVLQRRRNMQLGID